MGKENISGKAGQAYSSAKDNQYVRRLIEDEELRGSLIAAALAGRKALQRIQTNRASAVESVTQDKRVKKELQSAADSLRDAAERIKSPKKKRHPIRKLLLIGVVTGGLVLVISESARKSLLDAIFGAEEEFVYTSTTSTESAQTNGTPVGE
jgi:hypothetical protein